MSGCESQQDSTRSSSLLRRFFLSGGGCSFVFREGNSVPELLSEWLGSRDPGWWTPSKLLETSNLKKNTKIPTIKLEEQSLKYRVNKKVKNVDLWIHRIQTSHGFFQKKTDFSWEVNKSWQRSKNPGPHEWRSKHQKYALICRFFEWSDWRSRYVDFMNISWKKCLDALQGFLSIHLFLASF